MSEITAEHFLDISSVISGEKEKIPFDVFFTEKTEENGITFDGFSFVGKVEKKGDDIFLEGEMSCLMKSQCARCLCQVEKEFSSDISAVASGKIPEDDDAEDIIPIINDKIDIFSAPYEKLVIDLPFRLLCKEDCKGFCSKCGKNLNDGPCGCEEKEVDPRLQGLQDFFKQE